MTYDSVVAGLSPALFLKLDETSGSTANDSGSLNVDGTYFGTPSLAAGTPLVGLPNGLGLDGVDDYVYIPYVASGSTYTIVAVVKPPLITDRFVAVTQFPGSTSMPFVMGLNQVSISGTSVAGVWNAGCYSGSAWTTMQSTSPAYAKTTVLGMRVTKNSTMDLWVNGVKEATGTAPNWSTYTGTGIHLGRRWDSASYSKQWMYGFAMWESILSDANMEAIAAEVGQEDLSFSESGEALGGTWSDATLWGEAAGSGVVVPTTGQLWPRGNW
jgi:hypothetical protein